MNVQPNQHIRVGDAHSELADSFGAPLPTLGKGGQPVERGLKLVGRGSPSARNPAFVGQPSPVVRVRHPRA